MCEDFSFDKSILPSQLLNDDEVILEEWGFFVFGPFKFYFDLVFFWKLDFSMRKNTTFLFISDWSNAMIYYISYQVLKKQLVNCC